MTVLRARAICASCESRLPPRSEAFVDQVTGTVWCVTCGRYERQEAEEAVAREHRDPQVSAPAPKEPTTTIEAEPAAEPASVAQPEGPEPEPVQAGLHHDSLPETQVGPASTQHSESGVVTRLRRYSPEAATTRTSGVPEQWSFDQVMDQRPDHQPDVACVSAIDRGDPGEGRVGQTLEAARIHGLEVLHGPTMPVIEPIDHLAVCANGIWVVKAVAALTGQLERRDGGDWFTADPRLHIGGDDRSHLVAVVRRQVEAVSTVASDAGFSDIPVRGVLCFGSVNPAWVNEPFVIDGISVTWRVRLVEPMIGPALIDTKTRVSLVQTLASVRASDRSEAEEPAEQSTSRTVAG